MLFPVCVNCQVRFEKLDNCLHVVYWTLLIVLCAVLPYSIIVSVTCEVIVVRVPRAVSDYLLSNNHVNSLIVLKLDFSDEEVLAYYISFLKTLSFKLNTHTIHFFYNEVQLQGTWS